MGSGAKSWALGLRSGAPMSRFCTLGHKLGALRSELGLWNHYMEPCGKDSVRGVNIGAKIEGFAVKVGASGVNIGSSVAKIRASGANIWGQDFGL